MKQKFMYHYTNREGWKEIQKGQKGYLIRHPVTSVMVDSETVRGWMIPHRRLIPEGIDSSLISSEATLPAIFGLTEPRPKSWLEYRDCINVWDYLLSCCKRGDNRLVLLRISLTDKDNPLVFDYAHIRRTAKRLSNIEMGTEYARTLASGSKNYWDSRVPLDRYEGGFVLPEIVVFNPIPLKRIEFIEEIPRN